jgi:hypothetical protein
MMSLFLVPTLFVAICLGTVLQGAAVAQDSQDDARLIRTVLMSEALGKSFGGESYSYTNAKVDFVRKVRPSGFLAANKARMTSGSVLSDDGKSMSGTLTYADPLGRTATYMYTIKYKIVGEHHYKILKVTIKTYEPLRPTAQGYFVPSDIISLKKMKSMSTAKLLNFARENGEQITENRQPEPVKKYHVLVFCMQRLRDNAKWSVLHNDKFGTSWSKGDWHVASIDAATSLNGPDTDLFQIYYSPGKRSPFTKKFFLVGGITNQYLSTAKGPVDMITTSPETALLLQKYHTKNLPNLAQ